MIGHRPCLLDHAIGRFNNGIHVIAVDGKQTGATPFPVDPIHRRYFQRPKIFRYPIGDMALVSGEVQTVARMERA